MPTVPLHVGSPDALKKLWRSASVHDAARPCRGRGGGPGGLSGLEAQAEAEGLGALQRQANAARDRPRSLLANLLNVKRPDFLPEDPAVLRVA